jgi:hypothetical protein
MHRKRQRRGDAIFFDYVGEHSAWSLLLAKCVERLLGSGDEPGGGTT